MDAHDFVILGLLAVGGEIKGKTKLQKTMYLLGELTGHLAELRYRPHFYGPYSDNVADAVDRMKALHFVDQDIRGGGAVNEYGFEVCRYDYRLNDDGKAIAGQKKAEYPDLWRELSTAAESLKAAGDSDYMKLSIVAKTYFLLGQKKGEAAPAAQLAQLAPRFGWHVTPDQIKDAAEYLAKLGLVTLS